MEEDLTLEEAFLEIEQMIEKLEQKELPLEESFKLYAKGMEYLRFCNDSIERVEKKMLIINENGEFDEF